MCPQAFGSLEVGSRHAIASLAWWQSSIAPETASGRDAVALVRLRPRPYRNTLLPEVVGRNPLPERGDDLGRSLMGFWVSPRRRIAD